MTKYTYIAFVLILILVVLLLIRCNVNSAKMNWKVIKCLVPLDVGEELVTGAATQWHIFVEKGIKLLILCQKMTRAKSMRMSSVVHRSHAGAEEGLRLDQRHVPTSQKRKLMSCGAAGKASANDQSRLHELSF